MNYADSERFAAVLEEAGYTPVRSEQEADLIILNSCSVRQTAEDRILGLAKNFNNLKLRRPDLKVVLTGCMSRRSWKNEKNIEFSNKLKKDLPWVDVIIETQDFHTLPGRLGIKTEHGISDYLSYEPKPVNGFQAMIPVSAGCDHFCSYCIVPFARGHEICRSASDIINEFETFLSKGYKDFTLLGQTVNRYYNPELASTKVILPGATNISGLNTTLMKDPNSDQPADLLQLLQKLDTYPGEWWISFLSSHPNYMTTELIDFIAGSKHLRPYLHFAMQSGSDRILQKMNRRHTIADFINKALYMRKKIQGLALSTDIIVGFPGETEEDFQATVKAMQRIKFDMAYISEYSPRKGTASAYMKDNISSEEKARRKRYLNDEVLAKSSLEANREMLDNVRQILVLRTEKNLIYGRTNNNKDIVININTKQREKDYTGKFVKVKITSVTPWALKGKLLQ
jgi:tRNA-2-methylthio-N6-dimethylallyladenosine synthase